MMRIQTRLDSIAAFPLEERHAIVIAWLDMMTAFYERAALQRDYLRAVLEAVCTATEDGAPAADISAACRTALAQEE